eukprot:728353-Amorphochlora_amoeboformis.AAC.1
MNKNLKLYPCSNAQKRNQSFSFLVPHKGKQSLKPVSIGDEIQTEEMPSPEEDPFYATAAYGRDVLGMLIASRDDNGVDL